MLSLCLGRSGTELAALGLSHEVLVGRGQSSLRSVYPTRYQNVRTFGGIDSAVSGFRFTGL